MYFLTHAHIDHTGLLPLLYARGFKGQILMTDATADLCSIMLRDCAHIQMQEAEWKREKQKEVPSDFDDGEPLYTMEDAEGAIRNSSCRCIMPQYDLCERYPSALPT